MGANKLEIKETPEDMARRINQALGELPREPCPDDWENLSFEERAILAAEAGYPFSGISEEDDGWSF